MTNPFPAFLHIQQMGHIKASSNICIYAARNVLKSGAVPFYLTFTICWRVYNPESGAFNPHMNTVPFTVWLPQYNQLVGRWWHMMFHPAEPLTPPASCMSFPRRSTQLPGITRASSSFAVTQMELWPYGTSEARASPYRQSPHMVRRWKHTQIQTHTHTQCLKSLPNSLIYYSL